MHIFVNSCDTVCICMPFLIIPLWNWSYLHAAPALEFLSCSASCWLRALHDPKKEAQSCWECLKQLATTPSLCVFVASTTATLESSERPHPKRIVWNVWKMYRNGLTSNHLFGLFMPEASAGCYFGSCHGAKIEPHRCPSSWIQSYMSYMGRFQMPRKQVLSFSFQRDPRRSSDCSKCHISTFRDFTIRIAIYIAMYSNMSHMMSLPQWRHMKTAAKIINVWLNKHR